MIGIMSHPFGGRIEMYDKICFCCSREPWRPGGSVGKSPSRQPRSRSAERSRSQDRSRSKSPRSSRHVVISDVDQELIR